MDKLRYCVNCKSKFESNTAWAKYCSRSCQAKEYRKRKCPLSERERFCKQCGSGFVIPYGEHNKLHCSIECSLKSARESRSKFWQNQENAPEKMKIYYNRTKEKLGPDGNLKRFYKRYPNASRKCECCGEERVLDIAHKPGHERNGAWRSVKNTTIEKVWILCPTCHALIDRMNYNPAELGLMM